MGVNVSFENPGGQQDHGAVATVQQTRPASPCRLSSRANSQITCPGAAEAFNLTCNADKNAWEGPQARCTAAFDLRQLPIAFKSRGYRHENPGFEGRWRAAA